MPFTSVVGELGSPNNLCVYRFQPVAKINPRMEEIFGASVVVSVPARPDFLHVLRSVTASVAARLDFPYDAIDDLRLAVDEACTQLLEVGSNGSALTLRITPTEEGLEIIAATNVRADEWPPPNAEESLTWRVLSALADEARFEREDEGPALRLTKRLPRSGQETRRVPSG
jgi:serine/threonine-protein kinase RsbW